MAHEQETRLRIQRLSTCLQQLVSRWCLLFSTALRHLLQFSCSAVGRRVRVLTEAPHCLLLCRLQCRTTYCCRSRCMTSDSLPVVSAHCILLFARCESGDFGIMAALLGCLAIIRGGIVPAPSLLHTFKLPRSILLIVNCPCFNEFFIDCLSLALPC